MLGSVLQLATCLEMCFAKCLVTCVSSLSLHAVQQERCSLQPTSTEARGAHKKDEILRGGARAARSVRNSAPKPMRNKQNKRGRIKKQGAGVYLCRPAFKNAEKLDDHVAGLVKLSERFGLLCLSYSSNLVHD